MESIYEIIDQIKDCSNHLTTNCKDLFWKNLFNHHFINNEKDDGPFCDDMLFFVHKIVNKELNPKIDVLRKFSPNIQSTESLLSINWEETLFLNLILQKLEYSILYSICTRTSDKHYQTLSKQRLSVFATPSCHSVVFKESPEYYSYPIINFNIENFEEFLYENIINDLESIYIELIAKDFSDNEPFVIFSSSINYKVIDDAYCSKKLICNRPYFNILKIKDSEIEAMAEIVIKKKIKRSMSDGTTCSIIMDIDEQPNLTLELYLLNLNRKTKLCHDFYLGKVNKEKVFAVESQNILSDFNDGLLNSMWRQKGFSQSYFDWKEKQKYVSNSFHCFVTNISLPWNHIISQLLSTNKRSSILLV